MNSYFQCHTWLPKGTRAKVFKKFFSMLQGLTGHQGEKEKKGVAELILQGLTWLPKKDTSPLLRT